MKILGSNIFIFRITYFNPYPPDIGDFTFHILGNTIEECILDLCRHKNIKPDFVKEKCIICKLETISSQFLDNLISQNLNEFIKRSETGKKRYEEFLKQNPTKPFNTSLQTDNNMIFSVL